MQDTTLLEALYVVKRSGKQAPVRFDAITDRNEVLCSHAYGRELEYVRALLPSITREVVNRFKSGMTTHELDMLTAAVCASQSTRHRDFGDLAARIIVSDLQKRTNPSIIKTLGRLRRAKNKNGESLSRLSDEYIGIVERAGKDIDRRLNHARDFNFTCFGIQTMIHSYLLREKGKESEVVERPQHAYMRVALTICVCDSAGKGHKAADTIFRERLERAFVVYELLSSQKLTHASPTMFNAGTNHQQMSSCFLLSVADDLEALLSVDKDAGMISKWAGGIGIGLTPMRAEGSIIKSTGGLSSGIRLYIAKLNSSKRYVNQGGRRKGAYALYLEIWHADIFTFLEMGRFRGVEINAPDLMYALFVNDMFMEALIAELEMKKTSKDDKSYDAHAGDWYLFSPDSAPGLAECYGDEFRQLYDRYVAEKRYVKIVKTSAIMREWFKTVSQKGNPYILFKDHINRKSNLSHVRTITSSNLCAEITIPSWYDETNPEKSEYGVCNLAALPLASYVVPDVRATNAGRVRVDWGALIDAAGVATRNLDNLIDINYYPVDACRRSNMRHRPVALGVMGLADVLARFKYSYGSAEARAIDRAVHAAIYYGAMRASSALGKERGNFSSFEGSASQRGKLQPDLWVECGHLSKSWETEVAETTKKAITPKMWAALRKGSSKFLRNSYVTGDMPTSTSSQAANQNECFEPYTSNMYTRKTLAGEFILLNKYLLKELEDLNLWDEKMRRALIASGGSVQNISRVPKDLRARFRTARELDQRLLTLHAKARNPFLSQTQSLNYYFGEPRLSDALTVIVKGWKEGLTTGSYYIHTQPATGSQKTSIVDTRGNHSKQKRKRLEVQCTDEICTVCSV